MLAGDGGVHTDTLAIAQQRYGGVFSVEDVLKVTARSQFSGYG